MRVYIAGPMRGLPGWNFPAFDDARDRWRAAGHVAFSPADTDRALGYAAAAGFNGDGSPEHLKHVMLLDVACVFHADAIALLPGWERSRGATVEVALGQFLGLRFFDAVTMKEVYPPRAPWGQLADVEAYVGPILEDAPDGGVAPKPGIIKGPADRGSGDWSDVWRTIGDRQLEREQNDSGEDAYAPD